MELTKTEEQEIYITLLEAADILTEKCERDLTVLEFNALTLYFKKFPNDLIFKSIQKLPNRFIEHPVSYLKSILESHSGKEKTKSIVNKIIMKGL